MAVAPPAGVDWKVQENAGEPTPDCDGIPVGDGDSWLCWLGPALALPVADAVAEPLGEAELL